MDSKVVEGVKLRGFGTLRRTNPNYQRELASRGGQMAHKLGRAHEWDSATGRTAALKAVTSRRAKAALKVAA